MAFRYVTTDLLNNQNQDQLERSVHELLETILLFRSRTTEIL